MVNCLASYHQLHLTTNRNREIARRTDTNDMEQDSDIDRTKHSVTEPLKVSWLVRHIIVFIKCNELISDFSSPDTKRRFHGICLGKLRHRIRKWIFNFVHFRSHTHNDFGCTFLAVRCASINSRRRKKRKKTRTFNIGAIISTKNRNIFALHCDCNVLTVWYLHMTCLRLTGEELADAFFSFFYLRWELPLAATTQ